MTVQLSAKLPDPETLPFYKYTLGFIHCPETGHVLLLNRQKAPWMGRWNGVGGKLDEGETPMDCIIRETFEETGLKITTYEDRGVLRWFRDGEDLGGVHLFVGKVSMEEKDGYSTPRVFCHEGILDWKELSWILHEDNSGTVDNIKVVLGEIIKGTKGEWVACYSGDVLVSCQQLCQQLSQQLSFS